MIASYIAHEDLSDSNNGAHGVYCDNMKNAPGIFILILVVILVFVAGVRYGGYVEKQNKIVEQSKREVTIVPTAQITPSTEIVLYNNKTCQISFLIPNTLEKTIESSTEATFKSDNDYLKLQCGRSLTKTEIVDSRTISVRINGKTFPGKTNNTFTSFSIKNKKNAEVYFEVTNSFFTLLERSLRIDE